MQEANGQREPWVGLLPRPFMIQYPPPEAWSIYLPYAKEKQNLWENAERTSAESKESGPELTNLCIVIGSYGSSWGFDRFRRFCSPGRRSGSRRMRGYLLCNGKSCCTLLVASYPCPLPHSFLSFPLPLSDSHSVSS